MESCERWRWPLGESGLKIAKGCSCFSYRCSPKFILTLTFVSFALACSGYTDTTFAGKDEQAQKAIAQIKESGFLPQELVEAEVMWFYQNLGIDDQYFALESLSTICDHVVVSVRCCNAE